MLELDKKIGLSKELKIEKKTTGNTMVRGVMALPSELHGKKKTKEDIIVAVGPTPAADQP